jgi:hypothetical protein
MVTGGLTGWCQCLSEFRAFSAQQFFCSSFWNLNEICFDFCCLRTHNSKALDRYRLTLGGNHKIGDCGPREAKSSSKIMPTDTSRGSTSSATV